MKRNLLISFCLIVLVIATAGTLTDSGRAGRTDSPGEGNCSTCHSNSTNNAGPGSLMISSNIPNDTYTPGANYQISVTVSEAGRLCFGFGFEALDMTNGNAGTLVVTNATETQLLTASNSRINIVHTLGGGNVGSPGGSKTFTFDWTAPATDIGVVKFYAGAIAGIADADPGTDNPYTTFKSISSPTVTALTEPAVRVAGMYPNPVRDKLYMMLEGIQASTSVKVELFTLTGQVAAVLCDQDFSGDLTLDLDIPSSLADGLYLLKIQAGKDIANRKVLIQR